MFLVYFKFGLNKMIKDKYNKFNNKMILYLLKKIKIHHYH